MKKKEIRENVRSRYGAIARQGSSCCGSPDGFPAGSANAVATATATPCCCGSKPDAPTKAEGIGQSIGYNQQELASVPEGANLGLGCGNPLALASLKGGETVVDLGSGAGFDCFLAAQRVGENGKIIGVDMTPDMVEKARENAERGGYANVEFRLGEIEYLPVADTSVDLIISNCVINLSVDKAKVFAEAFRILKPDGRLMVSDIVLLKELPAEVRHSAAAYVGCIAGAELRDEYLKIIQAAGFEKLEVLKQTSFGTDLVIEDPRAQAFKSESNIADGEIEKLARNVVSVTVAATKPALEGD